MGLNSANADVSQLVAAVQVGPVHVADLPAHEEERIAMPPGQVPVVADQN